jgi:hypothetical protein
VVNECRHIKTNGYKCHSPALSGKAWCYFHFKFHCHGNPNQVRAATVAIKSVDDLRGIQLAVNRILASFQSPYVDTKRAGVFLYGLNLAATLARRKTAPVPAQATRTRRNEPGSEFETDALAPERSVCEPPAIAATASIGKAARATKNPRTRRSSKKK